MAAWAKRNPLLLLRLSAVFLLRLAERKFLGLLFQEPPRNTRLSSSGASPLKTITCKYLFAQSLGLAMLGVAYPAHHAWVNVMPL